MRRAPRPWPALGWLVFLVYPVAGFFTAPRTVPEGVLFWGVLLAFVALYVAYHWRTGSDDTRWALAGYAGALLTFGALFAVVGTYAMGLLVYGAFLVGYQRSRARVLALVGGYTLLVLGLAGWSAPLWQGQSWSWAVPLGALMMAVFLVFSGLLSHTDWQTVQARRALARAQAEKERLAADAERERIARDLHDVLGHTLSVIVLKSELAARLTDRDPARAAAEIREVEGIARGALGEVRAAVQGYRGSGLSAELARAKVALDAAGVRLVIADRVPTLPPATEQGAAMVLREAVTNVVRHARAQAVTVTVQQDPGGHVLTIEDDGVGGQGPEGTGLSSMRERLRAMGGRLERDGERGTRLRAFFPGAEHAQG